MWTIDNRTPFAAERCWVRDRDGAEVWLVSVKGTFNIQPDGELQVADEQVPVCMAPEYRGDPATSSLLYDSDLHHKKLATDILLNGHAYSAPDRTSDCVDVRLRIASVDKTVRVFGNRVWNDAVLTAGMSRPEPFEKMPIHYELAFGGVDPDSKDPAHPAFEWRNPVGMGYARDKRSLANAPIANVESVKNPITSWSDRPNPAGFGAIAGHWMPRVKLAGTYDERWEKERLPLLPVDFDELFYQAAPTDQQVPDFIRGGEAVEIDNATPDGKLRFQIPIITLGFQTTFDNADDETHRAAIHTVMIEPDFPRVLVTWHTNLPCHHKVNKLWSTTIRIKQRLNSRSSEETFVG